MKHDYVIAQFFIFVDKNKMINFRKWALAASLLDFLFFLQQTNKQNPKVTVTKLFYSTYVFYSSSSIARKKI